MNHRTLTTLAALTVALLGQSANAQDTQRLRDAVTLESLRAHQAALQAFADDHADRRFTGSPGYAASAEYVRLVLEAAGYTVDSLVVPFNVWIELSATIVEQTAPATAIYADQVDIAAMTWSANGDVVGAVEAVDLNLADPAAATSGCQAEDFAGFTAGNIALIQRSGCFFRTVAENAAAAGAVAAIIMNQGDSPERMGLLTNASLGGEIADGIPVVATTFPLGAAWATTPGLTLRIAVDGGSNFVAETLLADTPGGDPGEVILVGAHLDSGVVSPGINGNGSGVATVLEIAVQMAELGIVPKQRVRFAFWGGGAFGVLGSHEYLSTLPPEQLENIALYLDFRALGSPNFGRFIYDGDGSEGGRISGPGAGAIEAVFADYFSDPSLGGGVPSERTRELIQEWWQAAQYGIPTGGLTGGEYEIKTPEQAAAYGGTAGEPFDPCAGLACDTYANVSESGLHELADAAAHAVLVFATSTAVLRIEAVEDLIADVVGLGLPADLESGLLAKLNSALAAIDDGRVGAARNKLMAFINQVQARRGNPLSEAEADALIAAAQAILDELH